MNKIIRLCLYAACTLWLSPYFWTWTEAHEQERTSWQEAETSQQPLPLKKATTTLPRSKGALESPTPDTRAPTYTKEASSAPYLELTEPMTQEQFDALWPLIESRSELTTLKVGYSRRIQHLPHSITQMQSLEKLDLRQLSIRELPSQFGQLTTLKRLVILFTELQELPPSIGSLQNLEHLAIACNKITTLPDTFVQLTSLNTLALAHMKLTTLPSALNQLSRLTKINLWSNQLESLPDTIGDLENLTWIDLSQNRLTQIPSSIGKLKNLQLCNLSRNPIQYLPSTIQRCENLTDLRMLQCFRLQLCGKLPSHWGRIDLIRNLGWKIMLDIFTPQSYDSPEPHSSLNIGADAA